RAVCADAFTDRGSRDVGASGFSSLDARKRQRADRGETARDQTGLTQKTTAIETASSLIAKRRCKVAATGRTFCALDQHGASPSAWIAINSVEALHVGGVRLVTGFLLFRVRFGSGGFGRKRGGCGHSQTRAGAHRAQEVATAYSCLVLFFHRR